MFKHDSLNRTQFFQFLEEIQQLAWTIRSLCKHNFFFFLFFQTRHSVKRLSWKKGMFIFVIRIVTHCNMLIHKPIIWELLQTNIKEFLSAVFKKKLWHYDTDISWFIQQQVPTKHFNYILIGQKAFQESITAVALPTLCMNLLHRCSNHFIHTKSHRCCLQNSTGLCSRGPNAINITGSTVWCWAAQVAVFSLVSHLRHEILRPHQSLDDFGR